MKENLMRMLAGLLTVSILRRMTINLQPGSEPDSEDLPDVIELCFPQALTLTYTIAPFAAIVGGTLWQGNSLLQR